MKPLAAVLVLGGVAFADATPPSTFQLEGNTLKVPAPIVYETASDRIKPDSDATIAHVKAYLDAKAYISLLRIEVHSDSQGGQASNQALTEKRALAVARRLVALGIDCKRLIAVGFGESKPLAPNDSPEGRAQNRRTVFVNAALRGRPIGGLPVDGGGHVAGDACR